MSPRSIVPLDVEIGRRLRDVRTAAGMSQEELGRRLGITFQQVQKYEKGANRIAASRLVDVARELGVPLMTFIPEETGTSTDAPSSLLAKVTRERNEMAGALRQLGHSALAAASA